MPDVSENGDAVFTAIDEWGRRRIDSLLEDGTKIIVVAPPPVVVETIVAMNFPMDYLPSPVKAIQLISKVSGATIIKVNQDYPLTLIKKDKAQELKSKFTPLAPPPPPIGWEGFVEEMA
jgi:hypothetical protein